MNRPQWVPANKRVQDSILSRFKRQLESDFGLEFASYQELHKWSVANNQDFWPALWDFCGVIGQRGDRVVIQKDVMEEAAWFPDARLNFAENLLRTSGDTPAIIARTGQLLRIEISWDELHDQVSRVAQHLRNLGVGKGDRVAAITSNCPEAVVVMLATSSLGGIWTSVSPDFGEAGILERFAQTRPSILLSIDEYRYGGKRFELRTKIEAVLNEIPSICRLILIQHYSDSVPAQLREHCDTWAGIFQRYSGQPIEFEPMGFNDPLYILYSSGTTGKPKCIVHRVGGVLLQHLKEHQLHCDIQPADRVFFYTTCGWMMWNWLVSALASGATLILYDESPFYPTNEVLFEYAEQEGVGLFGTSASYLRQLEKQEVSPRRLFNLSALKTLCSTGSVLPPESFDFVYREIKEDLCLASIAGGTDIISCFTLGNPTLPVYRGECQCIGLGMDVQVWDENGQCPMGAQGELVCCSSFPSQPWGFWGDDSGERYHDAYFSRFNNVWHHGDFVSLTEHGGMVFHGRSDTTLNPAGVRIGTAEIYRQVETIPEILESAAVGQQIAGDERVLLFVKLKEGFRLDQQLSDQIKASIRTGCSPRHVPAKIFQVADIPKTRSGKIVELAIKQIIHNQPVKNIEALANPESLDQFKCAL